MRPAVVAAPQVACSARSAWCDARKTGAGIDLLKAGADARVFQYIFPEYCPVTRNGGGVTCAGVLRLCGIVESS